MQFTIWEVVAGANGNVSINRYLAASAIGMACDGRNGGVCYYPRLVDRVLKGRFPSWMNMATSQCLRRHECDRTYVRKSHLTKLTLCVKVCGKLLTKMEEPAAERLKDVVVAGKTGTARPLTVATRKTWRGLHVSRHLTIRSMSSQ
jgi:cell division protein FtsI/penicillin-binding protein 2